MMDLSSISQFYSWLISEVPTEALLVLYCFLGVSVLLNSPMIALIASAGLFYFFGQGGSGAELSQLLLNPAVVITVLFLTFCLPLVFQRKEEESSGFLSSISSFSILVAVVGSGSLVWILYSAFPYLNPASITATAVLSFVLLAVAAKMIRVVAIAGSLVALVVFSIGTPDISGVLSSAQEKIVAVQEQKEFFEPLFQQAGQFTSSESFQRLSNSFESFGFDDDRTATGKELPET